MLREDEEAAQAEVALAKEKVYLLEAEVGELTNSRDDAKEHYELIREQHRLGLLPQIQQLQEVHFHDTLAVASVLATHAFDKSSICLLYTSPSPRD